jgi:RNA polymerase sigma-70 factor, ECF subfamily
VAGADHGRGDDRDAAIFAALYPGLRRFAGATGSADIDPDDLVQEAVARTLQIRALVDLDDPGAYLRRAIVRIASNHRRAMGRRRAAITRLSAGHDHAVPQAYPSDVADLMRLSPRHRAALFLRDVEGASYGEVAEALGSSEAAARMTVTRARRRLRAALGRSD